MSRGSMYIQPHFIFSTYDQVFRWYPFVTRGVPHILIEQNLISLILTVIKYRKNPLMYFNNAVPDVS